nr:MULTISPECIES: type VI secretion system protein TssA [Tenebrionibacter/Tenebrionicola group]
MLCQRFFSEGSERAMVLAGEQTALWEKWLLPVTPEQPVGDDPGYDDDFQRMREEVNRLSGIDTGLICQLAETVLTTRAKDVRVVTYYAWARLHQDGEEGLAEGLALLYGLLERYGEALLPSRANSRRLALEWLAGAKVHDSLQLYPEVDRPAFERILASLAGIESVFESWPDASRPELGALSTALEARLARAGGADAVAPRYDGIAPPAQPAPGAAPPVESIRSGRELLDQTRALANYLRAQPQGWLAAHRIITAVRWDTVHQLPPQDCAGRTRLAAPRSDNRALLKRLWRQQSWGELLEQADRIFAEGVNHFWLDLQWYLFQALSKSAPPADGWADIIREDLKILLTRLPGLEKLAWEDGTPFADEVTREWLLRFVLEDESGLLDGIAPQAVTNAGDDILALEAEALAQADSDGIESALAWLQARPGVSGARNQWLLRLLMARLCEQFGKNDMALHLLAELDGSATALSLADWEPDRLFEVRARRLRLLRIRSQRSEADKAAIARQMEALLAQLTALDPVRAAVLY